MSFIEPELEGPADTPVALPERALKTGSLQLDPGYVDEDGFWNVDPAQQPHGARGSRKTLYYGSESPQTRAMFSAGQAAFFGQKQEARFLLSKYGSGYFDLLSPDFSREPRTLDPPNLRRLQGGTRAQAAETTTRLRPRSVTSRLVFLLHPHRLLPSRRKSLSTTGTQKPCVPWPRARLTLVFVFLRKKGRVGVRRCQQARGDPL